MKYISNRMMASSWTLWCEYIDPDATMPKAVFDEMTVEDRIGLIDGYIGGEFDRIPGYARQVYSGYIWADGSHEMQWSRRSTREACEQVVLEVVERLGIEAAFDDCRNGTIDADTYEAWIDGARDDSVIFSVYPGEDIVEAGASALGVCVSEALNTKQVTA
jgi:hypothetical protein